MQLDDPALVVDRAGGAVRHRLGHVVDVDVIAEHLPGVPVPGRDGGAGKAHIGGIGQRLPDDAGVAHHGAGLLFALGVLLQHQLFLKAVLAAVGLVCHHHDVPPFGQRLFAPLELEHGGENNAVGLSAVQQLFQVLLALGLHRGLAQKFRAAGKLGVELVVQVDAVGHHHDGGAVQRSLQQMGVEHHRQRLAAALGMPEHAALAVGAGGLPRPLHRLAHREILVIARQYLGRLLAVPRKEDEVLQNVQQPLFLEHPLVKGLELHHGGVLGLVGAFPLPLHEAVQPRGDGAGHIGGQVADDADGIVIEQRGDVLHVVADLPVGIFGAGPLLGGAFQLHQHERQPVDEQDHIRAAGVAVFHEGILVHHQKLVVLRPVIVHQPHDPRPLFPALDILHRDAVLQPVHKDPVFLQKAAAVQVVQLAHRLVDGRPRHPPVDPHKAVPQVLVQQRAGIVGAVQIRRIDVGVAHILE